MPAPVAAIAGGIGRGLLTGGRAAMAGGMRETIRGAARGAVKGGLAAGKDVASGVVKGKKKGGRERFKSPLNEGIGGGGGTIVPFGGGDGGGSMSSAIVPAPKSQVVPAAGGKGKTILDTLNQIKSLLDQILQVEKEEKSKLEDSILDFVRRDERQKRDQEQAKQEAGKKSKGKKGKESPIVRGAKKAVGGLWDFITGIVGDFIKYKILDWVSDPKNRKNVQRIVEFFQGMVKFLGQVFNFVMDNMSRWMELMSNGFKLAGALLQPLIDIFTLKWLTNPGEFIKNLINLPKTLLGIIPQFFGSLLNYLTLGLFENMGKFIGDLLSNLNPFKLFGGKEDDKEETAAPQPKKEGGGIGEAIGGALGMLNPMNWFGGDKKQESSGNNENVPKLEKGGIVGKESGDDKKDTGGVTVSPLSDLIKESKLSSLISEGIKPFMDMMLAPFKIIGTAIVGLILRTVSKIPFVGNLIEPIIKMTASTFGVPTNVLTQLSSGTKKELEKPIDKEKLLEKLFGGLNDIKEAVKNDENPLSKIGQGLKSLGGGIASFLGNALFGGPAAAATRPPTIPPPPPAGTTPSGAVDSSSNGGIQLGATKRAGESVQEQDLAGPGGFIQGGSGLGSEGGQNTTEGYATHFHLSPPSNDDAGWRENREVALRAANIFLSKGHKIYFGNLKQFARADSVASQIVQEQRAHTAPGRTQGGIDMQVTSPNGSMQVKFPLKVTNMGGGISGGYGRTARVVGTNIELAHGAKGSANSLESQVASAEKPKVSPTALNSSGSKTGPALQSAQNESLNLQASGSSRKTSTSILSDNKSSTETSTTMDTPSLGGTLPRDGLFATYRTNL